MTQTFPVDHVSTATLPPVPRGQRPSSRRAFAHSAVVVAVYVGAWRAASALHHPLAWMAAWWMMGLVLSGAFAAMHDCAHKILFRRRWANEVFGRLWALAIVMNFSQYRSLHLLHHARTATDDDPEPRVDLTSVPYYAVVMIFGGIYFVGQITHEAVAMLFGRFPPYVTGERRRRAARIDSGILLVVLAAIVVLTFEWPRVVLSVWLVPFMVANVVFMASTSLAEHYGCARDADVFAVTRTVLSNRFARFFLWNGNFHVEHHWAPHVPYFALPELRVLVGDHCPNVERSYLSFHWHLLRSIRAGRAAAKS
jgi:fatty acid desaturase